MTHSENILLNKKLKQDELKIKSKESHLTAKNGKNIKVHRTTLPTMAQFEMIFLYMKGPPSHPVQIYIGMA